MNQFTNCTRCNRNLHGVKNKITGRCYYHPLPKPRKLRLFEGCDTPPQNPKDDYCRERDEGKQARYKEDRARRKVKPFIRDIEILGSNPEQLRPQKNDRTLCHHGVFKPSCLVCIVTFKFKF